MVVQIAVDATTITSVADTTATNAELRCERVVRSESDLDAEGATALEETCQTDQDGTIHDGATCHIKVLHLRVLESFHLLTR